MMQEQRLQDLHDTRSGRIFIIGNGPSLLKQDLSGLEDEQTFVCNSFFLWEGASFTPTFYGANWVELYANRVDPVPAVTSYADKKVDPKPQPGQVTSELYFLFNSGDSDMKPAPEWIQVYKKNYRGDVPEFQGMEEPLRRIPSSATSPLVMGCLAIWMGFRELYFLGIEQTHGYTYGVDIQRQNFRDKETPFHAPRWKRFREFFEEYGISIADCTPDGRLNKTLGYIPLSKALDG